MLGDTVVRRLETRTLLEERGRMADWTAGAVTRCVCVSYHSNLRILPKIKKIVITGRTENSVAKAEATKSCETHCSGKSHTKS